MDRNKCVIGSPGDDKKYPLCSGRAGQLQGEARIASNGGFMCVHVTDAREIRTEPHGHVATGISMQKRNIHVP